MARGPGGGFVADSFDKPWPGIGVGGSLALDFVNTLDWRLRESPVEQLRTYAALFRWARSAGALDLAQARTLRAWGEAHPRAAGKALGEALEVREAIAAVFQAAARGGAIPAPPPPPLHAPPAAALGGGGPAPPGPGARRGGGGGALCVRLSLDTRGTGSRRWCTMEGCGNRNKARSFYRRSVAGRRRAKG